LLAWPLNLKPRVFASVVHVRRKRQKERIGIERCALPHFLIVAAWRDGEEIVVYIEPPKRMARRCGGEDYAYAGAVGDGLGGTGRLTMIVNLKAQLRAGWDPFGGVVPVAVRWHSRQVGGESALTSDVQAVISGPL
jgi:hypothetical protein